MGAARYELAVRDPESGKAEVRRWTAVEIQGALPWLKRSNAQGREILIRPAMARTPDGVEASGLVLVGGLSGAQVAAMATAGREAAAVVEGSPGSHEAWVRVPACDEARRREVGRRLAVEQGVGPENAAPGLYGRLAGFTNPEARDGQRQPWVLCRSSSGRSASAGEALVAEAGEALAVRAHEQAAARERAAAAERSRGRGGRSRDDGGLEL